VYIGGDFERLHRFEAIKKTSEKFRVTTLDLDQIKGTVDSVVTCVPPDQNRYWGEKFISIGMNVFLQKPIATRMADALALANLAENRRVVIAGGSDRIYSPSILKMKDLLYRSLNLGGIIGIQGAFCHPLQPKGWRLQSNALALDLGYTAISLIREIVEVHDVSFSSREGGKSGSLDFDGSGWKGNIFLSWESPSVTNFLTIFGVKGRMEVSDRKITVYRNASKTGWTRSSSFPYMCRMSRNVETMRVYGCEGEHSYTKKLGMFLKEAETKIRQGRKFDNDFKDMCLLEQAIGQSSMLV
jgi:predicted dehydrogenase